MFLWDRLYWQTKREILADIVAQVLLPTNILGTNKIIDDNQNNSKDNSNNNSSNKNNDNNIKLSLYWQTKREILADIVAQVLSTTNQ